MIVNNYPVSLYKDGEVEIQTNPKQLEATGGKVYLTIRELERLLELAQAKPSKNGGKYQERWYCQQCKVITLHDVYDSKVKCTSCGGEIVVT